MWSIDNRHSPSNDCRGTHARRRVDSTRHGRAARRREDGSEKTKVDGLDDHTVEPGSVCSALLSFACAAGDCDQHKQWVAVGPEPPSHFQSILIGQPEIEQNAQGTEFGHDREGLGSIMAYPHAVAFQLQQFSQNSGSIDIVVDDHEAHFFVVHSSLVELNFGEFSDAGWASDA